VHAGADGGARPRGRSGHYSSRRHLPILTRIRSSSERRGSLVELSDVDLYDPDNYVEGVPHEMFAVLRREAPVYRHPNPNGGSFWCVTRHADLVEVNRNAKVFSSWIGGTNIDDPDDLETARMMMLNMDQPEHTKLRKIVNTGFTPRRIRELQDILRQRARTIVDDIAPQGRCDFVADVAAELPLQAIADLLGVP